MANRRITDLPAISSASINDDDLLMVVDVAEVDPGLKNKKLNFSDTKQYFNSYYLQLTGGTIAGSLVVSNNLTVSGSFSPVNITVTGSGVFNDIVVTGSGRFTNYLSGNTITGGSIQGLNINATTGNVTTLIVGTETVGTGTFTRISGITITGTSGLFTTGNFLQVSGTTGLFSSLSGTNVTGVNIVGTTQISGTVVTGNTGRFSNITGVSGVFTTRLSGATITGDTVLFTTATGATGTFTRVSGTTVTGATGLFAQLTGVSGAFIQLSGTTVTGATGLFTNLTGSLGTFTNQISGAIVTGITGQFTNLQGVSGVFTSQVSGSTITGDAILVSTLTGASGTFTRVSGTTVTGITGLFQTVTALTGTFINTISIPSIATTGNITAGGNLFISGNGTFSSGIVVSGQISGNSITGITGTFGDLTSNNLYGLTSVSGNLVTGVTGAFTQVTATTGTFTTRLSGNTITGNSISGTSGVFVSGIFTNVSGTVVTGNTGRFSEITGVSGTFTSNISGQTVTGVTGSFTYLNGVSGVFTDNLSGSVITGDTGRFTTVSGISGVFTGTLSGATVTGGSANFTSITGINATITNTLSGATVTGSNASFTRITGVSGVFTTQLSGQNVVGENATFNYITGTTRVEGGTISGATVTGNVGLFTNLTGVSGVFTSRVSGAYITGVTIEAVTVTAITGNFTTANFTQTTTGNILASGFISGVSGLFTASNVSGIGSGIFGGGVFTTGTVSGTFITGQSGQFQTVSGATVTGATGLFASVTGVSGVFTSQLSGAVITGDTGNFNTLNVETAIISTGIVKQNITVTGNIQTSGTLSVGQTATIASGLTVSGGTISGVTFTGASGQFTVLTGNTAGFTTVTGTTVTGTTANFVTGTFTTIVSGATITGNTGSFTTITGATGVFTSFSGTTVNVATGVFASGTAASPSITFSGDLNTGIYSPGADQVAISTGGSGRLFVDADGEVGIGTGSPDGLLTLAGANSNVPRFRIQHPSSDRDAAISTYFDGSGTYLLTGSNHYFSSAGSSAKFDATSGSSAWYLDGSGVGIFFNSSGSGSITERFRIRADGTFEIKGGGTAGSSPAFSINPSAPANSLVIDSSGRLGVGTGSPSNKLTIYEAAANPVRLIQDHATSSAYGIEFYSQASTPYTVSSITASHGAAYVNPYLDINVADSSRVLQQRVRIDASGRVGIGTQSAVSIIHANAAEPVITASQSNTVVVNGDLLGAFNAYSNDTSINSRGGVGGIRVIAESTYNTGYTPSRLAFYTHPTAANDATLFGAVQECARFDSFGGFFVKGAGTAGVNYAFGINGVAPANSLQIDSSGRLLVGTSTARANFFNTTVAAALQVEGTTASTANLSVVANRGGSAALLTLAASGGSTIGSNTIVANNFALGGVEFCGSDGTEFVQAAEILCEVDGTPGANDMPGRLMFSTTADGASSPTERMRIDSSGRLLVGTSSVFTGAATLGTNGSTVQIARNGGANADRTDILCLARTGGTNQAGQANRSGWLVFGDGANNTLVGGIGGYRVDPVNTYNGGLLFAVANGGSSDSATASSLNEAMRIDSSGRLLVGTSTARNNFYNTTFTPKFQFEGDSDCVLSLTRNTADGSAGNIVIAKGRSNGIVSNNDNIGRYSFQAHDGTQFVEAAVVEAYVDGTPGADDMPGRLVFSTTADGASSPTERMRITQAGDVCIGTTSSAGRKLNVFGGVISNQIGSYINTTNTRIAAFEARNASSFDTARFAAIEFYTDPTTWYNGDIRFVTNNGDATVSAGTERMRIDSAGRFLVGTSSARTNIFNASYSALFQVETETTVTSQALLTSATAGVQGARLTLAHHRSGSVGGNTILQSGDETGFISFQGSDGSEFVESAAIRAEVDGTPGANDMPGRLVFSTTADGASSPTERMRIDSSGNLGIGTTNSVGKLTVATSSVDPTNLTAWSAGYFVVTPGGTTASGGLGLSFNTSTNVSCISSATPSVAWRDLIYKASAHRFAAGATNTEAARIDSSGRLLVGTSTARANFYNTTLDAGIQVENVGSTNRGIALITNSTGDPSTLVIARSRSASIGSNTLVASGDWIGDISFQGNDGTDFVPLAAIDAYVDGTPGANDMPGRLVFSTTADGSSSVTERMRIDSSGRVGIGTSSPGSLNSAANQLVVGGGSGNQGVTIYTGNGVGDQGSIFFADGTTGGSQQAAGYIYYRHDTDSMVLGTANTARLTIDSSGRVGIGSTSPSAKLQINQNTDSATALAVVSASASTGITSDYASLYLQNTNTTNNNYNTIGFINDQNGYSAGIHGIYTSHTSGSQSGAIAFGTSNAGSYAERARIDSSGRLLVGTSSSSSNTRLVVQGNSASSAGTGVMHLQYGSSTTNILNNYTIADLNYGDSAGNVGAQIKAAADANWGASSFGSRLTFSTTADGASSPTERLRIANNGQLSAVVPGNSTLYPGFLARVWINFDGTSASIGTGRASGNVSSVTDNGTGDYTINFSTAMPDTNYCVVTGMSGNSASSNGNEFYVSTQISGPSYNSGYTTTSSIRMLSMDGTGTNRDAASLNLAVFR